MTDRHVLHPEALTAEAFAPYGQVIAARADAVHFTINDGYAERFDDLARVDTTGEGGRSVVSLFRAKPRSLPMRLRMMERHRLGSQLFMPLARQRYLVVVAAAAGLPDAGTIRCFIADAGQGVNLAPGTWHHPLLALDEGGDYLVIDRGGDGLAVDCDVHELQAVEVWVEICAKA